MVFSFSFFSRSTDSKPRRKPNFFPFCPGENHFCVSFYSGSTLKKKFGWTQNWKKSYLGDFCFALGRLVWEMRRLFEMRRPIWKKTPDFRENIHFAKRSKKIDLKKRVSVSRFILNNQTSQVHFCECTEHICTIFPACAEKLCFFWVRRVLVCKFVGLIV